MPKFPTFPTLYDEVHQIRISDFKTWGCFEPGQYKTGVIKWSRNGNPSGSISYQIYNQDPEPFLILDYTYNGEPRRYQIQLVSRPSNLGKGRVWYFLCPSTKQLCRKLYSISGYFLHRKAFTGCMYDSQIQSKVYRGFGKVLGYSLKVEKLHEQLNRKHFKKTYAGKPTKKYLRIMAQIRKSEATSWEDVSKYL